MLKDSLAMFTNHPTKRNLTEKYNSDKSLAESYHGRELLELVQNADDACICVEKRHQNDILIEYKGNSLRISNKGATFNKDSIERLPGLVRRPGVSPLLGKLPPLLESDRQRKARKGLQGLRNAPRRRRSRRQFDGSPGIQVRCRPRFARGLPGVGAWKRKGKLKETDFHQPLLMNLC